MTKTIWGVVALVLVAAGGWYAYAHRAPADTYQANTAGTYNYLCDNGASFAMTPSADMSEMMVAGAPGASFGTVTLYKMGDANVYETQDAEMSLSGAGEEVVIYLGAQTMHCNPVASADMAPFNWGDSAAVQ